MSRPVQDYAAKIEFIMANFDFEAVRKAMLALNWTWYPIDSVPSVSQLKKEASRLLEKVAVGQYDGVATGGFHAKKDGQILSLHFAVETRDSDYYDEKKDQA